MGDQDDDRIDASRPRGRRWGLAVVALAAVATAACGSAAAAPAPRTGPPTDGIRLQLSTGSASTGEVVTTLLVGSGLDGLTSSGLVEVTCGVHDTRVSHPVQGVTGTAAPPTGRAPVDQPFDLPATAALRFTVPPVAHEVCVVSRSVHTGNTVLFIRSPLSVR